MTTSAPSKAEVYQRLKEVLATEFGLAPQLLVPGARLIEDLDLDSIDWIDMAIALEMKTGRKLDERDFTSIRTIENVVDVVHDKLQSAPW